MEAQHSNVAVSYEKLAETEHYTIKFTVSGSHVVLVQIKHANNTSLQPAFQKHLRYVQGAIGLTSIVAVLNFKYKDTAQFKALKEVRYEDCSLIEISAQLNSTETKEPSMTETCETSDLTFELDTCNDSFIELEDFDWQFDENYTDEKRRGGQKRHRKTTEIKETLIHPMFSNRTLIRGESIKQRAEKINRELSQIPTLSENELELFSKKYKLNLLTLKHASAYFEDDRQAQIYRWCLAFSKEATHAQS
ncbi:MAG: hypothetical protein P8L47_02375 [Candidatus Marinamargulisbacteria bacterium]|nr:hypothetical protein [Candidatus Marinamargulisbacteria bacterium]